MTIAIFGAEYPEQFNKYIHHLIKKLEGEHINLLIEEEFYSFLKKDIRFKKTVNTFNNYDQLKDNADFLLSIGGDGTLLKAVTYIRDSEIPILGINTGRLGFISSVSTDQIDAAINDLLKNNYTINERTLLELNTTNNLFMNKNFALNEVAVTKKDTSSMIKVDAYVDDEFLTCLCDDLNTPAAMARLHELARCANKGDAAAAAALKSSASLLGLLWHQADAWAKGGAMVSGSDYQQLDDAAIDVEITARNEARAAHNFAEADAIRDKLAAAGIMLEDGQDGTIWRRS